MNLWWQVAGLSLVSTTLAGEAFALDLRQAVADALVANPAVASAAATADAAVARAASVGTWPAPMVEFGLVNVPTTGRFDMDPMTMKMVGVSQRLRWSGASGLFRRAAGAGAQAEAAGAELTRLEVMGEVWIAYAQAWFATERALEAMTHGSVMERLVAAGRARYAAGQGRLEDMLLPEAEQSRVRADVERFRGEADVARGRLDALRGLPPGTTGFFALSAMELPPVPRQAEVWTAVFEESHPRRVQAVARAEGLHLGSRAARRSVWPDLELRGAWGFRDPIAGVHGEEAQDDMFSVSVGFMVPLFAAGPELRAAAEQEAMARAADQDRRGVDLELQRAAHALWIQAAAADHITRLLADTVLVTQRKLADAAWSAYGAGASDLVRVFEANHGVYTERLGWIRSREELALTQGRFLTLSGRADLLGLELPSHGGRR